MNARRKEIMLLNIEASRLRISKMLKKGKITDRDLINLIKRPDNYGVISEKNMDGKDKILKEIFNAPFLLCDQEYLNPRVRSLLPYFLKRRYNMEVRELEYLLDLGQISNDEYLEEKENLKYCYYKSSNDGMKILEKNKVKVK